MAALLYIIVLIVWEILYLWSKASQSRTFLNKHPIVVLGGDGYWTSWKTCLKYFFRWPKLMGEGYFKYNAYQVPTLRGFLTFINRPEDIRDYFSAPESVLSLLKPLQNELQLEHTLPNTVTREIQDKLIALSRRILSEAKVPYDMLSEEIDIYLKSKVEPKIGEGWNGLPVFKFASGVIPQAINRILVGEDLCRNEEFLECAINWAEYMVLGGQVIRLFPTSLKQFAARYLTNTGTQRLKFEKIMEPIVRERVKALACGSDGSSTNSKSAFLDGLIQGHLKRNGGYVDPVKIARQTLIMNTSATHTITQMLTKAIYELAERPELCEMLREEYLQKVGSTEGYENAVAVSKDLPILDSFLKEVGRMHPPGHSTSFREVLKPFTFSSGLHIPAGVTIAVPTVSTYRDPQLYPDPDTFDPLRFVRKSTEEKVRRFVDTSTSSYLFSHGVHVCPGRWVANASMKLVIIKLLEQYDIRLEVDKPKPSFYSFQVVRVEDMKSKIELRRRERTTEVS